MESLKDFIKDIVENYEDLACDLQGIIEARIMQTNEDYEEIYQAIMKEVRG